MVRIGTAIIFDGTQFCDICNQSLVRVPLNQSGDVLSIEPFLIRWWHDEGTQKMIYEHVKCAQEMKEIEDNVMGSKHP
jgi:hypothetical protein